MHCVFTRFSYILLLYFCMLTHKLIQLLSNGILAFGIFSCNTPSETSTTTSSSEPVSVIDRHTTQKYTQAKALSGYWLSDSYTQAIEQSKSVYASREYTTKLFGFILSEPELRADTAYLNGFTEHEGGYGCRLRFDPATNQFASDTQTENSYFSSSPFTLVLKNPHTLHMNFTLSGKTDTYRKVPAEDTELRRILFAGMYQDSLSGKEIVFQANGKVTGFGKHSFYTLVYDFGEGINYDTVIFFADASQKNNVWDSGDMYHFKRTKNTLTLYKITPNWETMEHTVDSNGYTLFAR